jgi:hypothetical protein
MLRTSEEVQTEGEKERKMSSYAETTSRFMASGLAQRARCSSIVSFLSSDQLARTSIPSDTLGRKNLALRTQDQEPPAFSSIKQSYFDLTAPIRRLSTPFGSLFWVASRSSGRFTIGNRPRKTMHTGTDFDRYQLLCRALPHWPNDNDADETSEVEVGVVCADFEISGRLWLAGLIF